MNQLMGDKLSIITPKAQTTRHRIMGFMNEPDYQIVFSDTPGIVAPAYKLHEGMMQFVNTALQDADVLIVLVEIGETTFRDPRMQESINESGIPTLVLINKVDTSNQDAVQASLEHWKTQFPHANLLGISALHGFQTGLIVPFILKHLPESPPYFPKEDFTDKSERFFVSEMIREKIFLHYQKEVPYSCEVVVESFKDTPELLSIRAEIWVERESQKIILIGKNGAGIKRIGTEARKDAEAFFGKKVFLDLFVKVDRNWRNTEHKLKKYGYLH